MSYVDSILNDAPVFYLRTGERSGTTAFDNTGAHNGTYAGGYTLGQPGLLPGGDPDGAVLFDGINGNISIPDAAALEFTTAFSLEFWINYLSMPTANPGGLAKTSHWYLVGKSDGHFEFGGYSSTAGFVGAVSSGVGSFTTGQTYHVVGTYDHSNWRIYQNSVLMATLAGTNAPTTTTDAVLIGGGLEAGDATVADFIHATMDEIAGYNYKLTDAQVQTHYAEAQIAVKPQMDAHARSMMRAGAR